MITIRNPTTIGEIALSDLYVEDTFPIILNVIIFSFFFTSNAKCYVIALFYAILVLTNHFFKKEIGNKLKMF